VEQYGSVARAKPRVSVTGQFFPSEQLLASPLYNIQKECY